jgi:parallel beta-helix repeat protein
VWTNGIAGKALYFDGTDDNVTVTDSNSLDLSNSFTLSAWVNPASAFTDFRSILAKNYKYYLYASGTGFCGDGSALGGFYEAMDTVVCQPSSLPVNTWTHLTLTYNGAVLTLYRDGGAVATANVSGTISPSTGTLQIGASEYGEYFQGLIDEVRVYNKALTNTEIQTIYQQAAVTLPVSVPVVLTVATPTITPNTGSYSDSVSVAMQTTTSGAAIYYTTDGSTPTQSSVLYSGAITLSNNTTVKAKAFKSGYNGSSENSASFTVTVTAAPPPPPPTSGNAYYVANNGSDSYSCTQARSASTPKRTIGAGLACVGSAGTEAGAGYTVQVAAGTYTDSIVDKIPSGSGSSNPFTLQCDTDFACILNPGGTTAAVGINTPSHYFVVRGFKTISGSGWYFSAYAAGTHHHISFINNEWLGNTMHSAAMGIQASGTDTLTVRGNRIYGLNGGSGYSHAIYAADSTTNWTIEDNDIYDNGAYGIHLYGTGSTLPSGFIIRRNHTYRNGTANVNGTGIITYGPGHQILANRVFDNRNEGILLRAASGTMVDSNVVYANAFAGISKESGSGVTCQNNFSANNGVAQISGCDSLSNNTTTGTPPL